MCQGCAGHDPREEISPGEVGVIGVDLAKRSFQLHGARADGPVAFRMTPRRGRLLAFLACLPRCVVVLEACASEHYQGLEVMVPGHEVRLVPSLDVEPFVKRQKNNATNAEAVCEAGLRAGRRIGQGHMVEETGSG